MWWWWGWRWWNEFETKQEKIVKEYIISLPNVVSGALVLTVTGSSTVARTEQKW
jgi:hypothetical protein